MIVPVWFHRRFLAVLSCIALIASMTCVTLAQAPNVSAGNGTASGALKLLEPKPITPGHVVVTLFPPGHPALRAGKNFDKEEVMTGRNGRVSNVTNIHNPSIELYLAPPEKANGMAMILAAGGANRTEGVGGEGVQVANWLNSLGVSCFIERYRLSPEGYSSSTDALLDTQRSVRVIRAHAKEWNIDPHKIGHMGFSAGGEQSARLELNYDLGNPSASDPIDRESCRPDFVVLVYAGWIVNSLDMSHVPADVPPAFLVCAGTDDMFHSKQTVQFYTAVSTVGAKQKPRPLNIEMHIYGHGAVPPRTDGHGGGISARSGIPYGTWPQRFVEWAIDAGLLPKGAEKSGMGTP
ncbi:MAG TPA: alpha/beta hydrolase [Tepidisphaeraceae bacterium]|nr:alpha/beta hydrolase [Tepidisphaeraceae bacterium]